MDWHGKYLILQSEIRKHERLLYELFVIHSAITKMKLAVINQLENGYRSLIVPLKKDGNKLTPTSHEGYVVHNWYGSFKLVDRRQFSYQNFTNSKFHK
jgi:hypothetical protein